MKRNRQQSYQETEDDWGLSRSLSDQYERYSRSPSGREEEEVGRLRRRRRPRDMPVE